MSGLENLQVYTLAEEISNKSWEIYMSLNWEYKKVIWDQFIRAIDSIGANIAEWFGRYHYLDSAKFYYNARWSLYESKHRISRLYKRKIIEDVVYHYLHETIEQLGIKLNNFISATKKLTK